MMLASIHPLVNIELDMIFNNMQSFSCGTRYLIQVGTTFLFLQVQIGADNLQTHYIQFSMAEYLPIWSHTYGSVGTALLLLPPISLKMGVIL